MVSALNGKSEPFVGAVTFVVGERLLNEQPRFYHHRVSSDRYHRRPRFDDDCGCAGFLAF